VPGFVQDFYQDKEQKLNDCIGSIFVKDGQKVNVERQTLNNAPRVDQSRTSEQLQRMGKTEAQVQREQAEGRYTVGRNFIDSPFGVVLIASDYATLPIYSSPEERNQTPIRTYVHELGNILSSRFGGSGKAFGDRNAEDPDTGQRLEDCVFNH